MPKSKFSDAEGNCSKEFGDHGDAQNHALANNQTSDLHQTNQSVGAKKSSPSNDKSRKRKADMKEVDDEGNKKNANTSLEDGHVSLEDRWASMEKSLKRQKKSSVYLKSKVKGLADEVENLFMHILQTESNRSENQILLESIVRLQARNAQHQGSVAQLKADIAQLENESKACEANKKNDSQKN